jgi:hypothetical protein
MSGGEAPPLLTESPTGMPSVAPATNAAFSIFN